FAALFLTLVAFPPVAARGVEILNWNTNQNRITADIKSSNLIDVLEQIAAATRWQVFVEPDTLHAVSAKFTDLPPGEALRLLLGDVIFVWVQGTTSSPKLFVFRTSRHNATQLVHASKNAEVALKGKPIPNELIVRLKPGAKIDDLAKLLGAKVLGRIDSLNAYRLQFDDAAAAGAARDQLAGNPDGTSVDNNYLVERPDGPQGFPGSASPLQLQLKPPPDNGRIVIGLIDTAVQPLGNNLNQFLLKQLSVAGDPQISLDSPTHGTAMAETILRSLENITKGSTSIQILPVNVYPNSG